MITDWKLRPEKQDVTSYILTGKPDVEHYSHPHILIIPVEDETMEDDLAAKVLLEISTPMTLDVELPVRKATDIIVCASIQLSRESMIALAKTLLIAAEQKAD